MAETNSKLIDITRLTEYDAKIKAWAKELDEPIDQEFTTNNTVGALESGTVITRDMTLAKLITDMLVSVKDATLKSKPTCALTNSGTSTGNKEVGTTIETTLSCKYSDGSFNSYKANSNTETEVIAAGCELAGTKYYKNDVEYNEASFVLGNEIVQLVGKCTYKASTNKAKKSDHTDSALSISAGTAISNKLSYTGLYRYYVNQYDSIPETIDRTVLMESGGDNDIYSGGKSVTYKLTKRCAIVAVIGTVSKIIDTTHLNNDITSSFIKRTGTIADAAGNDVNYNIYVFEPAKNLDGTITITFN